MSDLWESLVNLYRLRLIPTVKRMLDRRRLSYTLLTVGILGVCAAALALLIAYAAESVSAFDTLSADYEEYLAKRVAEGFKRSPMPELRDVIALAKGGATALAVFCGGIWLMLSAVAVGWVMSSVMESEAYVYGLYMIYGADRRQLSRQLSLEFLLAGIPALCLGTPSGLLLYRAVGGSQGLTPWQILLSAVGFLLLILCSAAFLSRRVLKRPCMSLLNASDTSDLTISPRRSHPGGLNGKRGSAASALLAFLRMRRHYVSLALVAAIVSASAFGSLSYKGTTAADDASHTFYFTKGITAEDLQFSYLDELHGRAAVKELSYAVAGTAESLGTHIRLTESQNPTQEGVYLGTQYATDSIRIACGDGETYTELGGCLTIPPAFSHLPLESLSRLGYDLEAVPAGCAVYVYPEQNGPTLQVKAGDHITLSLPDGQSGSLSRRVEAGGETVTLRIADVVEVGSVVVMETGEEVCPRITEDYLYVSPPDYERFSGDDRALTFTAEEVYPDELFGEDTEGVCILAVPEGYFEGGAAPDTVTVIHPRETAKELFSQGDVELEHEEYFKNKTYKATGVYLGTEKQYLSDPNAAPKLEEYAKDTLQTYLNGGDHTLVREEYTVTSVITMPKGSEPYLILPRTEEINYNRLHNDLCALRLSPLSKDTPAMNTVKHEAYVLSTSVDLRSLGYGKHFYLGTSLMGDFVTSMESAGISLQAPLQTFAHSRVTTRGSFSVGDTHYLLAEPFSDFIVGVYPEIDADQYPRLVTGEGCFCSVGNPHEISILSASETGFYALLHGDNIGGLRSESIPVAGYYAVNHWMISPASESDLAEDLPTGFGVLSVRDPANTPFRVGDNLSVAVRQDTSELLRDPALMGIGGDRLLSYLLEHFAYEYVTVEISAVVAGDTNTLIIPDGDLESVLGQEGIYRELKVYLNPDVTIKDYLDLHVKATALAKQTAGEVTLLYDEAYVTKTAEGLPPSVLMDCVGGTALCLLPLLLLASQFLFYGKRGEEFTILRAIGRTVQDRKRLFASEICLFCGMVTLTVAVSCPVGYGAWLLLTDGLGLPTEGLVFDPLLYGGVVAVSAVFSAIVGLLACKRAGNT